MQFAGFVEAIEGPDKDLNFAIKSGSKKTSTGKVFCDSDE